MCRFEDPLDNSLIYIIFLFGSFIYFMLIPADSNKVPEKNSAQILQFLVEFVRFY